MILNRIIRETVGKLMIGFAVASVSCGAVADLVWSYADTSHVPNGPWGGWSLSLAPSFLSMSGTGSGYFGETGTASVAASIPDGYLKAGVFTTSADTGQGYFQPGQASATVGLEATVNLAGPQGLGGVVAVTLTFDGAYSDFARTRFQLQTGAGLDGMRGFANLDSNHRGFFDFSRDDVYGSVLSGCTNCTYSFSGGNYVIGVTTLLPFNPGDSSVIFAAQILVESAGGFIDGMSTATFAIGVPSQFTYTSNLRFQPVTPIPEPSIALLLVVGIVTLTMVGGTTKRTARTAG